MRRSDHLLQDILDEYNETGNLDYKKLIEFGNSSYVEGRCEERDIHERAFREYVRQETLEGNYV